MKHLLIVATIALFASSASAQDACPEFANMVTLITDGGKSSKELALEKPVAKQSKKGIYRGHDTSVRLEGLNAKVQATAESTFAFRPLSAQIHPAQQIKLFPFNSKRSYRELVVGGTNMWGGSKNRKASDNSVSLEFKKIKDGCYKITIPPDIPKGEYAFSLASVGQGQSADVKGANAGYGSSVQGQTWFGFSVK